jgi:heterodisulfide reductase subunit D
MLDWAKVDMPRIVRAWREEIVSKGLGPPQRLREVNLYTEKYHNPFGREKAARLTWASGIRLQKKGDVIYFAGCYASYSKPEIARSTASILSRAQVNFAVLEDEKCCGIPQMWNGETKLANELASSNVAAIMEAGAKKVVTTCPGCYMALKRDYPEITGKADFEVFHITEFLDDLVEKRIVEYKKLDKTVTYHDPCHLGRYSGIYEQPRKIIESIPGIELVEMKRNKANAWCCGSGIVVAPAFPKLSLSIAERRIREAEETGADILATACPSCVTQLHLAARRSRSKIEVVDLVQLTARALK